MGNKKTTLSVTLMLIVLGLLGLENNASAAEYYVSAKTSALLNQSDEGSLVWNEAVDISKPCSAGTAMTHAVAGDIVYFRGGIYLLTTDNSSFYRANGALNPASSGEDEKPIVFMAFPGEVPTMDVLADSESESGIAFGLDNHEYITYDGFKLIANSGNKMGGVKLLGNNVQNRLRGITVRNCEFNGGNDVSSSLDNYEGLRIEQTSGTVIENCIFYGFRNDTDYKNTSALKMYFNDTLSIRNCEISNSSCGIFLKADNSDSVIYNNYIHNNHTGVLVSTYLDRDSDNISFYNNVLTNIANQGFVVDGEGTATSNNLKLYNNTFYKVGKEGVFSGKSNLGGGIELYNNIFQKGSGGDTFVTGYTTNPVRGYIKSADHNNWNVNFLISTRAIKDQTYNSLESWQLSGELEEGGNPGTGSLASDPVFLNASKNMNQLDDFRLSPDSPCKEAGRGGVDIGADIDSVGIRRDKELISRGDVDGSSNINITDALLTLQSSLGFSMSSAVWQTSTITGDVDCNGVSNSIDALLILRYSWGLEMRNTAWCD